MPQHAYYDFFAGGGMSSFGLGSDWACLFANEIDPKKGESYRANHHGDALLLKDVAQVRLGEIPSAADLVWASFPCQDLSIAGKGAGLAGQRSGMFRPFWALMEGLKAEGRAPRIITLENVCGAITSNGGRDFATLATAFSELGYRVGAVVVDAVHFLPQSRPRFFMIGVRDDVALPEGVQASKPVAAWHPASLIRSQSLLTSAVKARWVWWSLLAPPPRTRVLADLIEQEPMGVAWHDPATTTALLASMNEANLAKVDAALMSGRRTVGAIYKRTRQDALGGKVVRAEVRFDGVAGCLRTPSGGSSRQTVLIIEKGAIRSRLLSPREIARLMGLPDTYVLPAAYNQAYKLAGDGVAVPVVAHLNRSLFMPILGEKRPELS